MYLIIRPLSRAFTLIELLIVVAIIAILAAIAVPNFLEAQVRSKVSRAKSDMRSLATAMESYHVDNNSYTPSTFAVAPPPACPQSDPSIATALEDRYRYLTTPIAYISSVPNDVFGDPVARSCFGAAPLNYAAFDLVTRVANGGAFELAFMLQLEAQLFQSVSGRLQWYMASQGPDQVAGLEVGGGARGLIYDPTNGTVSDGDIFRTGPGDLQR